jgi:hypothetical protein
VVGMRGIVGAGGIQPGRTGSSHSWATSRSRTIEIDSASALSRCMSTR